MKKILFLSFLLSPLAAQAALPPYYQSANEIKAIMDSREVAEALAPYPIDSIVKIKEGYRVTVGNCFVDAEVIPQPQPAGFVGPVSFTLNITPKKCEEKK